MEKRSVREYEFIKQIGTKPASSVYKVMNTKYKKIMVAKVFSLAKDFQLATVDEAKAEIDMLSQLDHPNVIRIYDSFVDSENYYLIFEECSGGSLANLLESQHTFDHNEIKSFAQQLLNATNYCHSKQIAHHDIKPSSILFDYKLKPKLSNFGISICAQKGELVRTYSGSIPYLAPEILQKKAFDPFKADIWALGIVFYQLYFGKLPWKQNCTVFELIDEINKCNIQYPNSLPSEWKQLFCAMLNENPKNRLSAAEILTLPLFQKCATLTTKKSQQMKRHTSLRNLGNIGTYRQKLREVKSVLEMPTVTFLEVDDLHVK